MEVSRSKRLQSYFTEFISTTDMVIDDITLPRLYKTEEEWRKFIKGKPVNTRVVPKLIYESWQRSMEYENKVGEIALNFGAKSVFCVYDKGVSKIAGGIVQTLKNYDLKVLEFDGVIPNQIDQIIEDAAQLARDAKSDVVVAIGGGSSIDTAKALLFY